MKALKSITTKPQTSLKLTVLIYLAFLARGTLKEMSYLINLARVGKAAHNRRCCTDDTVKQ